MTVKGSAGVRNLATGNKRNTSHGNKRNGFHHLIIEVAVNIEGDL
ncbi:MAG TPA: hypothetical protein VGQ81_01585 [Acidobacteriota bacterium]|nr:hypothetical protein [Acidobacteriota bacterium]